MACYKHLLRALNEQGYYSYRLGIQAMSELRQPGRIRRLAAND